MPLTDQDIRALTYLAVRARPRGAARWDEAGIAANIAKVRHLAIADVSLAVIRAAADPSAATPGVIANTTAPNWRERATSSSAIGFEPLGPAERCSICSLSRDRCAARSHLPDGHTFTPDLPPADPETGELLDIDTTPARALVREAIERIKTP